MSGLAPQCDGRRRWNYERCRGWRMCVCVFVSRVRDFYYDFYLCFVFRMKYVAVNYYIL